MKTQIIKFLKDEEGATAIEYGLIAGLVSVAIIAGLNLISPELSRIFTHIGNTLVSVVTPA